MLDMPPRTQAPFLTTLCAELSVASKMPQDASDNALPEGRKPACTKDSDTQTHKNEYERQSEQFLDLNVKALDSRNGDRVG